MKTNVLDITSADLVLTLTCIQLWGASLKIESFAEDDMIKIDDRIIKEIKMGLDGVLATGRIYAAFPLEVNLLPGSDTVKQLDILQNAERIGQGVSKTIYVQGSLLYPSTGAMLQLTDGVLQSAPPFASAGKTQENVRYKFVWSTANVTYQPIM